MRPTRIKKRPKRPGSPAVYVRLPTHEHEAVEKWAKKRRIGLPQALRLLAGKALKLDQRRQITT
jgi:hypothetical protein